MHSRTGSQFSFLSIRTIFFAFFPCSRFLIGCRFVLTDRRLTEPAAVPLSDSIRREKRYRRKNASLSFVHFCFREKSGRERTWEGWENRFFGRGENENREKRPSSSSTRYILAPRKSVCYWNGTRSESLPLDWVYALELRTRSFLAYGEISFNPPFFFLCRDVLIISN